MTITVICIAINARIMKFYNREKEIKLLHSIEKKSIQAAQMTFVVGRRRIGKTSLLAKAYQEHTMLYFFVAKKNESLLCQEFVQEIRNKLQVEIFGELKTFKSVFGYLMELSKTMHFTLIIDEFQEFKTINPSIYSDMQNSWDSQKDQSKINLILCGSVYSLMSRIFEHSKEPLFGRATGRIHLKEFTISTLKEILIDYHKEFNNEDLLAFYLITGGVAKYVELLVQENAFSIDHILNVVLSDNSLFLDEGRNVLIDEFGKEYGNYFSILSLIASSKTSRLEIESIMEMQVGGFLDRLENEFGIISKVRPIFAKPSSRSVKYHIKDNFLNFWFRFIYKYRSAVEIGNFDFLKKIINRDYNTFSGPILEKYFIEKMKQEGNYSNIGTYWEKGNQNEIDIVALNELDKSIIYGEVKRNKKNISLGVLEKKTEKLQSKFSDYQAKYIGLSIEDM
ncbi:putative ATPase (AAA+ superfamily) protein [Galbibacter marinus]|uniref:Putative ATPase (AAA+ superfamily) protein n=2 Tax=Galbibacter marinus TaxID=555500 RepID=K2Q0E1_9FLAO|nr:putative ATPase (AAA+ superfamily) protein [Galbibacter marinus]